jgi:tRNA threonylcarbamoyladenosine biosynthesis protein TsaE
MKKIVYTEKQINEAAAQLINEVPSKILCLHGDMGAGKTTLIKALVKQLGAKDEASSPTFGIVNVYHSIDEMILAYHFDFYRLNDEHEALDLGIEDYFSSEAWLFMEWPEKIEALLPEERVDIFIEVFSPNTRRISF